MKVLLFARLREALGSDTLALPPEAEPRTVGELRRWIAEQPGALADAIGEANVVCAVNRQVVDDEHGLAAGDEIAFFPPVTGG